MGPADPVVEVEGLTFRYRRATAPALHDLSLQIRPGEVLLVAGPSGCGKSTLIRALNGLIPHAYSGDLSGVVRVDGRPTTELRLREIARHVGTVLQDPAKQIVGATVEAELAFGPENLGTPRSEIRERLGRVIELTGLEELTGRETAMLSGGERQLVAVAGILMMTPRLYVVDEPLANLDPAAAARLLGILRALADRGDSVVIVEHRVEEALELRPERVLYLEAGRIRYLGGLDGFYEVADPSAVKLPFDVVLERARAAPGGMTVSPPPRDGPASAIEAAPRLEYQDVRAGFGDREVLKGVTASLGRGEVVGVLGPNGSGKTTLLRTAMRLIEATSGGIRVEGRPIRGWTVAELATVFGYVFQSPSQMLFARTVREELLFGPRNLGRRPEDDEALIADVLRRASLDAVDDLLERPPLTLSFGQQKRLAIAIALALQPPALILDEPSAGQDHRTATHFMAEIIGGRIVESTYLITHDVDLALTHADRILLFRDGRIVGDDRPGRIIEDLDRWIGCNLRITSLMQANARWPSRDGSFRAAEVLAREVAGAERPMVSGGGGSTIEG